MNNKIISLEKSHYDFIIKLVNDAITDYCEDSDMSLKWLHRVHPAYTNDVYMNDIFPKIFQLVKQQKNLLDL